VLAAAGHRVGVLTNSARAGAEASLEHAGLREAMAFVVSAEEVRAYKPDGRVYARLLESTGADADDAWLVAAHWWDVMGARAAGMRTGWVAHKERRLSATAGRPDVTGDDLLAVAREIARRR